MDVLRFLDSLSASSPLRRRISRSIAVVEAALHLYPPGELIFSFNGGKDSTVVLHLIRAAIARRHAAQQQTSNNNAANSGPANGTPASTSHAASALDADFPSLVRSVYFESPTRKNFAEVLDFMGAAARAYGMGEVRTLPGLKAGMATLVREGARGVIMGTRRGDPDGGDLEHFTPTSLSWPPCMRVCPVLDWEYSQVWQFLRGVGVSYCVLYEQGYTSLGSTDDSWPNPKLMIRDGDAGGATLVSATTATSAPPPVITASNGAETVSVQCGGASLADHNCSCSSTSSSGEAGTRAASIVVSDGDGSVRAEEVPRSAVAPVAAAFSADAVRPNGGTTAVVYSSAGPIDRGGFLPAWELDNDADERLGRKSR